MASEWRAARIEEVAEKVAMGPFGSSIKVETFVPSGVPVISGQHLHGYKLDESVEFNFVSREHADRLKNANVQRGDIIFTHAGNIGQVAYVPEDSKFERYVISQRQFYMRCDRSKIIPEFVVAYFKTPEGQHRLLANASQVGVPSIAQPVTYLRTIEIPVPPLSEQRAIAHILGTLDDKIELNRRMNETLEAMACAIFKSWFVDFDPVIDNALRAGNPIPSVLAEKAARRRELLSRANAEGRDSCFPKHIAALFPDRFVDSELGPIPAGWPLVSLIEIIEINPPRPLAQGQVAPYLDMANMPTHGHAPDNVVLRPFSSGTRFINGDTLMARITPCLENGKTAFVDFLNYKQVGWGSTEYIILRSKPPLPEEFAYLLARSREFRDFAIQSMTGTSGRQRVQPEALSHYRLISPPTPISNVFGVFVKPLFSQARKIVTESQVLATIRDALLPKLIRGELSVAGLRRGKNE